MPEPETPIASLRRRIMDVELLEDGDECIMPACVCGRVQVQPIMLDAVLVGRPVGLSKHAVEVKHRDVLPSGR